MGTKLKQFIDLWLIWLRSLSEALAPVGFRCIGLPWSTAVNTKMENDRADKDRPRTQVIDYVYKSPTLPHANLVDSFVIPDV